MTSWFNCSQVYTVIIKVAIKISLAKSLYATDGSKVCCNNWILSARCNTDYMNIFLYIDYISYIIVLLTVLINMHSSGDECQMMHVLSCKLHTNLSCKLHTHNCLDVLKCPCSAQVSKDLEETLLAKLVRCLHYNTKRRDHTIEHEAWFATLCAAHIRHLTLQQSIK